MATHRSLNKLEFKAHMSIHNFTEVPEGETHETRNGTRDRFGKTHPLTNEDGSPRLGARENLLKVLALVVFLSPFFFTSAHADEFDPAYTGPTETAAPKHSTDVQVGTDGLDANSWLNEKYNKPEDKFAIPMGESTTLGFNEDGDPSVGTRF